MSNLNTPSGFTNVGAVTNIETSISSASNAMTIDASLGNVFYTSMTENTTLTINNLNSGQSILLIANGHASNNYTITFPTMKKRADFTGVVTATKYNIYCITKQGSTLYGTVVEDLA